MALWQLIFIEKLILFQIILQTSLFLFVRVFLSGLTEMKRSDVNEGHHFMDSDSVLIIKAKVCKAPGFACAACLQQQCQQPHHGPVSIHSLPSLTMISDYKPKKNFFLFFFPSFKFSSSLSSFLPSNCHVCCFKISSASSCHFVVFEYNIT